MEEGVFLEASSAAEEEDEVETFRVFRGRREMVVVVTGEGLGLGSSLGEEEEEASVERGACSPMEAEMGRKRWWWWRWLREEAMGHRSWKGQ